MSTTSTFYGSTSDDVLYGDNATYLTARSTYSVGPLSAGFGYIGQYKGPTYQVFNSFTYFDTGAGIPDNAVIESVVLSLYGSQDLSTTAEFNVEARLHTWSAGGLTSADWVPGANLAGKTLLATFDTTPGFSVVAYNVFTSEVAFIDNISKTGYTEIILTSSLITAGTAPAAGNQYVGAVMGSGTNKPKLVVVHHQPTPFTCVINTSSVA